MAVALAGVAGFLAAVLALGLAMAFWRPAGANALHAAFAAAGLAIIAGSVAAGLRVRAFLQSRRDEFARNASDLLAGIQDTSSLSRTLALQVDDVIAKCRLMDERFLGLTMAVMVREYNSAERFDDRQKALMNAITILEKLGPKLSPWYIRHDRLIAATVSIVGIASGAVTVASNLSKLLRGA
ncbi:MAG: hypothetical protein IT162_23470 [Bryobacterales bacterium]|nr:hypothetical protein [Bryobacterales bacterium]